MCVWVYFVVGFWFPGFVVLDVSALRFWVVGLGIVTGGVFWSVVLARICLFMVGGCVYVFAVLFGFWYFGVLEYFVLLFLGFWVWWVCGFICVLFVCGLRTGFVAWVVSGFLIYVCVLVVCVCVCVV